MANISNLGRVGTGGAAMVSGFAIGPGDGAIVLIRAAGPTLGAPSASGGFGFSGVLPDPVLTVYSGNTALATNSAWNASDAATMSSVGAFPFGNGSNDAAIVASLAPGTYTAAVSGSSGDSGVALLEVYEVGPTPTASRLINLSAVLQVGSRGNPAMAGFVVSGSGEDLRPSHPGCGSDLGFFWSRRHPRQSEPDVAQLVRRSDCEQR